MIFKVQNLGYIEEAEVDLSKDLIVLTGQNNTGKTYLAYAIYGLFNTKFISFELEEHDISVDNRSISLGCLFEEKEKEIGYKIGRTLQYHINDLLTAKTTIFENFRANLKFENFDIKKFQNTTLHFDLDEIWNNSEILSLAADSFIDSILSGLFPKTYIAPAERNAINIFSKELSLTKSKLFKNRNGNGAIKDAQFVNRYPIPIQDNLEIAEDLAFLSKNKSDFEYLAIELEQEFLKGKIITNQYGQIEYQPDNQKDISLEIHLTASMVKSLSNIVFYLRHLAQKGDCIIIDEPELNLHPDNQRKIARFIGRLINEGFQVVISTHSDYIVKELNNMIMLSKAKENNQGLIEKLGFRGDELLKPEQVQALLFTLDSRKPTDIEITEEGFNVTTIDETIAKQDALTEEIYYQLFEQEAV